MTPTIEAANEELRRAVSQRREAQAAGKPSEEWYGGVTETLPEEHVAEDSLHAATRLADDDLRQQIDDHHLHRAGLTQDELDEALERLRGDSLLREDRPLGSVEWLEAVEQLRQLHFEKTQQYGDEDPFANVTASAKCGVEPWRRALCDLSDCVVRMQRYANGQPVDYENALMDAANWALICLVKLREAKA